MYSIAEDDTPPAIELDLAKAHLKVTHSLEDNLIKDYIVSATTFVEAFTGIRFVERDLVLQSEGWNSRWRLPRYTKSLISVEVNGSPRTDLVLAAGMLLSTQAAPLFGPCEIALRVGVAGDTGGVPGKYRSALLAAVGHLYVHREGQDWPAGIYAQMRTLSGLRL